MPIAGKIGKGSNSKTVEVQAQAQESGPQEALRQPIRSQNDSGKAGVHTVGWQEDENGKWSGTEDLNQRRRFTRNTTWNLRAKKNNKNELVTLKARANDNGILQVNNTEYHPVYMDKNTGFYYTAAAKKMIENNPKKFPNIKFKTGGLADFTGPAWLDGTKSKPELVLNQKDTQNFIALKNILGKEYGITASRGKWVEKKGILYMPTWHPAALLRDESKKVDFINDLKLVVNKFNGLSGQ